MTAPAPTFVCPPLCIPIGMRTPPEPSSGNIQEPSSGLLWGVQPVLAGCGVEIVGFWLRLG